MIGTILGGVVAGGFGYFVWHYLLVTFHTSTGFLDQLVIPIGTMIGGIYSLAGGAIAGGLIAWKGFGFLKSLLTGGIITLLIPLIVFGTASGVESELWLCVISSFPIGAIAGSVVFLVNRKIAEPPNLYNSHTRL